MANLSHWTTSHWSVYWTTLVLTGVQSRTTFLWLYPRFGLVVPAQNHSLHDWISGRRKPGKWYWRARCDCCLETRLRAAGGLCGWWRDAWRPLSGVAVCAGSHQVSPPPRASETSWSSYAGTMEWSCISISLLRASSPSRHRHSLLSVRMWGNLQHMPVGYLCKSNKRLNTNTNGIPCRQKGGGAPVWDGGMGPVVEHWGDVTQWGVPLKVVLKVQDQTLQTLSRPNPGNQEQICAMACFRIPLGLDQQQASSRCFWTLKRTRQFPLVSDWTWTQILPSETKMFTLGIVDCKRSKEASTVVLLLRRKVHETGHVCFFLLFIYLFFFWGGGFKSGLFVCSEDLFANKCQ